MRVVLVTDIFPNPSETFIVSKFVGLADRGVDIHVWCDRSSLAAWRSDDRLVGRADLLNRIWPRIDQARPPALRRLLHAVGTGDRRAVAFAAARSALGGGPRLTAQRAVFAGGLRALEPDVVHFEFATDARRWVAALDGFDCPTTVSVRGFDVNYVGLGQEDWYQSVWSRVAAVHVLGEDLWRRTLERGCPPSMAHSFIRPAIDLEYFGAAARRGGALGTLEQPLRLLSVSRLHWKKGLIHALGAVARLRADGVRTDYRIAGDGPDSAELHAAVADLDLGGIVTILGALRRDEVRNELRRADLLVHPAVSEGFSNAVVEAQATGLPVVATDADGLPENVQAGVSGLIVPRRDTVALANAIAALAADGDLRIRMGVSGRERAVARHQMSDHLDAWEAFYRSVLVRRVVC
jgi:colanic acid/amylovoran biosynthesis glycosyltransferase